MTGSTISLFTFVLLILVLIGTAIAETHPQGGHDLSSEPAVLSHLPPRRGF